MTIWLFFREKRLRNLSKRAARKMERMLSHVAPNDPDWADIESYLHKRLRAADGFSALVREKDAFERARDRMKFEICEFGPDPHLFAIYVRETRGTAMRSFPQPENVRAHEPSLAVSAMIGSSGARRSSVKIAFSAQGMVNQP